VDIQNIIPLFLSVHDDMSGVAAEEKKNQNKNVLKKVRLGLGELKFSGLKIGTKS
jgi:hypothetical protein